MIQFSAIHKRFGRLQALDNVHLSCREGATIALIGPNGSGKTTLIKCLLGMVLPDKGSVLFRGEEVLHGWSYRAHLGYMPQAARYPDHMTVSQVIAMMKDLRGKAVDDDLMRAFRLDALSNKKMRTLSGGTRQKVSACLAFLFDPSVIVLDEPTAGLDPVAAGTLREKILLEAGKGKLVLITSHILTELDDLVSEVAYLQDGRVRFHKSMSDLQEDTGERKLVRAIARIMEKSETV